MVLENIHAAPPPLPDLNDTDDDFLSTRSIPFYDLREGIDETDCRFRRLEKSPVLTAASGTGRGGRGLSRG